MGVQVHLVVGGESVNEMRRRLASGVHVVVGTPGRVKHMLHERALDPRYIKIFVLDEVDVMLSRGFEDQVCSVLVGRPINILDSIHDHLQGERCLQRAT